MSLVLIDVWSYGRALMPEKYRDRRLGWCDVWHRAVPGGNPYANPVAGLKLIVDMSTMELLEIEDNGVGEPAPVMGEYLPDLVPGQVARDDLKALHVTQPDGVSFTLEGTELRWQNWRMRIGFNYREGPVLYQVSYDDHGTERPIAYRMSFAEMVVPYRDPTFDHYRRTAFDIGEWGLGFMTTSLELGCDCLGEIRYLDAVLHDSRGEPVEIPNAVCLHEEDSAVLWKHVDGQTGAEVRRMRRMVVSCHATVANYEYLVYWRFYQDGNIECEVRATGIMVTTPIPEGEDSPAVRDAGRPPHLRAAAPAFPGGPPGSRRRRRGRTPSWKSDSRALPIGTGQSVRPGGGDRRDPGAQRIRVGPGLSMGYPARLESHESRQDQRVRHPGGLQAGSVRVLPGDDGSGRAAVPASPRDGAPVVGDQAARGRAVAVRGLSDAVQRRHRAQSSGSRTTSRWRTPMWCCGTSSASIT